MRREEFEDLVQEAFDSLPEHFRTRVENVRIVVDETDRPHTRRRVGVRAGNMLLGLYEGVPLNKRGADYGIYPVVPDSITLYRLNIEAVAGTAAAVRAMVRDVLIHELGHYFGMTEEEVRKAGY